MEYKGFNHRDDVNSFEDLIKKHNFTKVSIVKGGAERQDSVYNGIIEDMSLPRKMLH